MNGWEYCQTQAYLTYNLGFSSQANIKTDMGSIVHKVLEILAKIKLAEQKGQSFIEDEIVGKLSFDKNWLKPTFLTKEDIDSENKFRSAKSIYKYNCLLKDNHVRYGVELVNFVIDSVYKHFTDRLPHHDWDNSTRRQVKIMSHIPLDFKNGMFDPRKRDIVSPEGGFDFPIKEDWAILDNGEYLRLKGTIDLVTKIDNDTLELCDWKTGQRMDWAAKDTPAKDYARLCKDTQLMLYYYAVRQKYPEYKNVILSIFFIRDGGPFSLCFDDSTIEKIKLKIRNTYLEIKKCELPKMVSNAQTDFRCTRLCHFYKNNYPNSNKNICRFIQDKIKEDGIDLVSEKYKEKSHSIDNYQNPGEV